MELKGSELVSKLNIEFEEQYPIGQYIADVYILDSELVIEWDGDYWHSLKRNKERDIRKDKYLKRKGLRVLRFWEHEVYDSPEYVTSIIQKAL